MNTVTHLLLLALLLPSAIIYAADEPTATESAIRAAAKTSVPTLSGTERTAILNATRQALDQFVRLEPSERQGDEIPARFWGAALAGLKPLRVLKVRMDVMIVLQDDDVAEEGLYFNNPVSSPYAEDKRLVVFEKLSQPEDTDWGTLWHYRLLKAKAAPSSRAVGVSSPTSAAPAAIIVGSGDSNRQDGGVPVGGPLVFGPETNGLRMAVELRTPNEGVRLGEAIQVSFHVQNVSTKEISISGASWRQLAPADTLTITDGQGRKLAAQPVWYSGLAKIQRAVLKPGQSAVFRGSSLEFLAENADASQVKHPVGSYAKAKPGRHTVSYKLHFPDVTSTSQPGPNDWQGDLEAAPVTIEVGASRTP